MKVAFHTLGCKVNQYETEAMAGQFEDRGFERVSESDLADVYVINTCSVTSLADRKSRQYIRKMKRLNPESIVAVTGCYAQIASDEVTSIEGVDIVMGMNEKHLIIDKVIETLESKKSYCHVLDYDNLNDYIETGEITSMESRTRAYIKIQEGCNRFCAYCIIPYARGKVRSRSVEMVVSEAEGLIKNGFKELILTGINTALYGMEAGFQWECRPGEEDLKGIEIIIKRISEIPGDFRLRLSSLEPTVINAEYVKRLARYPRLCPHMHLSIQSGSNKVIELMNRHYTRDEYMEIVKELKKQDPDYGITTDIIVGFPGETEEDFLDSLDMVQKVRFCKVHVFKYSKRPGTKAVDFPNQVNPSTKKDRSQKLIDLAKRESEAFFKENSGKVRQILFEEYETAYVGNTREKFLVGYTDNYIRTYVRESMTKGLDMNEFYMVRLEEVFQDGMMASLA